MTAADIEAVIAAQSALIAALDHGDVAAIERTTGALAAQLAAMRGSGATAGVSRARVGHALKQAEAAATRVNYLADRVRQRRLRLAARRDAPATATYTAAGRHAIR